MDPSDLDMPRVATQDGVNVSKQEDGGWYISISVSSKTAERLVDERPSALRDFAMTALALISGFTAQKTH